MFPRNDANYFRVTLYVHSEVIWWELGILLEIIMPEELDSW